jgi:hypothetical protein
VVVLFPAVRKRVASYDEGKAQHDPFDGYVMDDIDTQKGKTGKKQGKKSTMYGTGESGSNTQCIPIDF